MSDEVSVRLRPKRKREPEQTPVQPPEPVQETVQEIVPETVPEPAPGPAQAFDVDVIRSLLSRPKSKDSIPTLTCIDKGYYKRYMILDVDGEGYREAWEYYRSAHTDPTPEDFVAIVTRILQQDMPRMHRAVSYVPLV